MAPSDYVHAFGSGPGERASLRPPMAGTPFPNAPFPRNIYVSDSTGGSREASNRTLSLSFQAALQQQATAWGDDGHKVVALIAQHYLTPTARKQVDAMLAADTDPLTQHDIASEATWADRYRDANHRKDNYDATKRWHFVDLEITDPDMKSGLLRPQAAACRHAGLGR